MDDSSVKTLAQSSGGDSCYDVQILSTSGSKLQEEHTHPSGFPESLNRTEELYEKRDNSTDQGKPVEFKGVLRKGLLKRSGEKKITVDEFVGTFCRELLDEVAMTEGQTKMAQEKELDAYLGSMVNRTLECLLEKETEKEPEDETNAGQIFQDGLEVFIDTLLQRVTEAVQHHPENTLSLNDKQQHQVLVKVSKSSGQWTGQSLEVFQGKFETTIGWEWLDGLEKAKDIRETIAKTDSEGRVWVGHQVEKSLVLQGKPAESENPKQKTNLTEDFGNDDINSAPLGGNLQESTKETITRSKYNSVIEASKEKVKHDVLEAKSFGVPFCTSEGAANNADQSSSDGNVSPQTFADKGTFKKCEELRNYSDQNTQNVDPRNAHPNIRMATQVLYPQFKADDMPLQMIEASIKNRAARVPKIVKAVTSAHRRTSGTQLINSKTSLVGNIEHPKKECSTNVQVNEVCGTTVKKAEHTNQSETSKMADNKGAVTPTAPSESAEKGGKIKRSISHRVKELLGRFKRQGHSEDTDSGKDTAI